jgi:hypothetical protein
MFILEMEAEVILVCRLTILISTLTELLELNFFINVVIFFGYLLESMPRNLCLKMTNCRVTWYRMNRNQLKYLHFYNIMKRKKIIR